VGLLNSEIIAIRNITEVKYATNTMADESITRMNLSAIKKIDPYAKEIVDSSSHVAFYTFNSAQNEWEKTDVEGAFFIYQVKSDIALRREIDV